MTNGEIIACEKLLKREEGKNQLSRLSYEESIGNRKSQGRMIEDAAILDVSDLLNVTTNPFVS